MDKFTDRVEAIADELKMLAIGEARDRGSEAGSDVQFVELTDEMISRGATWLVQQYGVSGEASRMAAELCFEAILSASDVDLHIRKVAV